MKETENETVNFIPFRFWEQPKCVSTRFRLAKPDASALRLMLRTLILRSQREHLAPVRSGWKSQPPKSNPKF
jgi:hypothetical protein